MTMLQNAFDLLRKLRAASLEFKATVLLLLVIAPLSVFAVVLALLTITLHVTPAPPPMEFSSTEYAPETNPLCAGEPLQFHFASAMYQANFTALVARSIVRERAPDQYERVVAYPVEIVPQRRTHPMQEFTRTLSETRTLPPGKYVYDLNVQSLFSSPVGFSVPFQIVECAKP